MNLSPARSYSIASPVVSTGHLRITPATSNPVDVSAPSIVLGRDLDCDLRFEDIRVSRHHAEIYTVGNILWLRDLDSEDGTYLDGELVEAAPIELPSEVRLGSRGPVLRLEGLRGAPSRERA